jgi:DNA mismatch endonuclease (patch repair protein)
VEFWKKKFAANISRDAVVQEKLTSKGWRVAIVWECALRNPDALTQTAEMVANWLKSDELEMELGELQVEPH